ncbi:hypothetical protein E4U61_006018 [Claviceps capensis]|nr:hypothetical protein E4U61_006018 [Claviceps capensis]
MKRRVTQPQLAQTTGAALKVDIIEACECLRQWLRVAEKDERDLREVEEEVLQSYQDVDIIGNNHEHGGLLDGPEFDQEIEDDE